MTRTSTTAALAGLLLSAAALHAQLPLSLPGASPSTPAVNSDPFGRSTPHGTVLGFLRAAQSTNFVRAANYLQLPKRGPAAEELAHQLKSVLDFDLVTNLDRISDDPQGNLTDSLPPDQESIGVIHTDGTSLKVILVRVNQSGGPIWLFSDDFLRDVPDLFEDIGRPEIESHLPDFLLIRTHIFYLRLWQLLALLLAVPAAFLFAGLLTRLLVALLRPVAERVARERAEYRLKALSGPVRFIVLMLTLRGAVTFLTLPLLARQYWVRIVAVLAVVGATWLLLRIIEIAAQLTVNRVLRSTQPSSLAVVHLVRRLLKATAVGLGVLLILQSAGVNLTPILAGVSVAGIAIAFAAQKTLENLFGGIMIITDEPIRVGDYCKFGTQAGTVEDIGLRSTRFRTNDRTVVAVPNGQLAAMNLENFSVRDKILFNPTIGLRYETTADQLRFLLAEFRRLLYAHPMVETSSARARFVKFADSSLNVEIFSYVRTRDFVQFLAVQEDLLLRLMDIVEAAGSGLAFPSQTLYFGRDSGLDQQKGQAAKATVDQWRSQQSLPFPDFAPSEIAGIENRLPYPPPESASNNS